MPSVRLETEFIDWGHFGWVVTDVRTGTVLGAGGGHSSEEDAQGDGLAFVEGARGRKAAEEILIGLAGGEWTE